MDLDKIERGFRLVLEGLGCDPEDPHLRETPRRTALAWHQELCAGLRDPAFTIQHFPVQEGQQGGMIVLQHIPVKSICAHHLLPFQGEATVAYLPGSHFCGLSSLSKAVDHFARRPQVQENLTHQVARFLFDQLEPEGLGVLVRASHQCMELRGVNHSGLVTTTSLLGSFQENPVHRAEFFALSRASERAPT